LAIPGLAGVEEGWIGAMFADGVQALNTIRVKIKVNRVFIRRSPCGYEGIWRIEAGVGNWFQRKRAARSGARMKD
jgi:hypothetical protein